MATKKAFATFEKIAPKKKKKKPWNALREEHASSSSSGRTGSSKGFEVVARERRGSAARKFG
jgi:hypothetical protein